MTPMISLMGFVLLVCAALVLRIAVEAAWALFDYSLWLSAPYPRTRDVLADQVRSRRGRGWRWVMWAGLFVLAFLGSEFLAMALWTTFN